MAKYIALVVVVLGLTVAGYFGTAAYKTATNTPENAAASFSDEVTLAASDTYDRLSPAMQKQYTRSQWQQLTKAFRGAASPVQSSHEALEDVLNAYSEDNDPQRFTYAYTMSGREYLMRLILIYQGDRWLIDDMQGDYI